MSWVAVGVGAASIAGGLFSSKKASDSQKSQLALQKKQLEFSKKRYTDAQDTYGDTIDKLVDLGNQGVKADLDGVTNRALADTTSQFSNTQEALGRAYARMGINPNSGQYLSGLRQASLAEARAKAGVATAARMQERANADNTNWNRLSGIASLGVNQMNGTAAGVSNSLSGLSATYANQANQLNQAAAAGISSGISGIFGGLASRSAMPASTTNGLAAYTPIYDPYQ